MSTSLRELSFLMLFFIVSMVLYATFAYYCEQNAEATGVSYIFFILTLIRDFSGPSLSAISG